MELESVIFGEPSPYRWCVVGRVVVDDDMDVEKSNDDLI